jgi:hypothetical protein
MMSYSPATVGGCAACGGRSNPDIDRTAALDKVRASGPKSATPGPDAAQSQDFLYGEDGLPR